MRLEEKESVSIEGDMTLVFSRYNISSLAGGKRARWKFCLFHELLIVVKNVRLV